MSFQQKLPSLALWIVLAIMLGVMPIYHHWTKTKPAARGVIHWDVISYYSYLPATFIYGDVKMGFLDDPAFNNDNKFWPVKLDNGNYLIQTTMGVSMLYSPFFFLAHGIAGMLDKPQDGFCSTYQLFLILSSLFWVMMGLLVLRRTLLRYFSHRATAITLMLIALGTNLFFYTIHEGPMSHSYNFAFICFFLNLTISWHEKPGKGKALLLGLVYGMIVLMRPTNVLVGIIFLLWGISDWDHLFYRPMLLLKRGSHLLLMLLMFLLPWIPQLLYWKAVTGSFVFNSYNTVGSSFYFGHPHIFDILFSFRKGWLLYTPVMAVAIAGLLAPFRKLEGAKLAIVLYLLVMIYVLASWWSWWNGGSFGLRSFVDLYGIMALPLAAMVEWLLERRRPVVILSMLGLTFLVYMNQFQTAQYFKGYVHHTGMTSKAYFLNFLSFRPDGRSWEMLAMPDATLARLGIYYEYYTGDDHTELKAMDREAGMAKVREELSGDKRLMKEIKWHARRSDISMEEALDMVTERVWSKKTGN